MADNEEDVLGEVVRQMTAVAGQFKDAFEKVGEEMQYRFDKELGKALAQHPELYAELSRTFRQVKKTLHTATKSFGLK